jgi:two-component system NarL family response regulator
MESTHRNSLTRVLVVDDHTLMRKAVVTAIQNEPGLVVVGEARNGEEAVELACSLRPDVVLMDLLIPKVNGVEAISLICKQWPGAKILAFSVSSDDSLFFAALRAGAVGYVTKTVEPDELLSAIRTVGGGASYLPSMLAHRLVNHFSTNDSHLAQRAERLTPRERDVVSLVGQGCNNRTIAEMLGISAATVRIHLRHAQEKLGLHSRAQIAFFVAQYPLGMSAT